MFLTTISSGMYARDLKLTGFSLQQLCDGICRVNKKIIMEIFSSFSLIKFICINSSSALHHPPRVVVVLLRIWVRHGIARAVALKSAPSLSPDLAPSLPFITSLSALHCLCVFLSLCLDKQRSHSFARTSRPPDQTSFMYEKVIHVIIIDGFQSHRVEFKKWWTCDWGRRGHVYWIFIN